MLNKGDYNWFSDLYSVCLKTIDHLNFKLWIFSGHTASFKIGILKVQDFGNFELSPMHEFGALFWHMNIFCLLQFVTTLYRSWLVKGLGTELIPWCTWIWLVPLEIQERGSWCTIWKEQKRNFKLDRYNKTM